MIKYDKNNTKTKHHMHKGVMSRFYESSIQTVLSNVKSLSKLTKSSYSDHDVDKSNNDSIKDSGSTTSLRALTSISLKPIKEGILSPTNTSESNINIKTNYNSSSSSDNDSVSIYDIPVMRHKQNVMNVNPFYAHEYDADSESNDNDNNNNDNNHLTFSHNINLPPLSITPSPDITHPPSIVTVTSHTRTLSIKKCQKPYIYQKRKHHYHKKRKHNISNKSETDIIDMTNDPQIDQEIFDDDQRLKSLKIHFQLANNNNNNNKI